MRTIAIVNQKGGCGKTTTAINLSAVLARRGLRTLLVDMDPQSHCAAGLGVPEGRIEFSVADAMLLDPRTSGQWPGLVWEVARNLDLAPSTVRLAGLEAAGGGLHAMPDKDRRLAMVLERLAPNYDCCLIDCPPTIGLLTYNALRASREALVPVETGFFSLKGAEKQWATIQKLIERIGRPIATHLLPTLHKPQSKIATEILAALQRQFAGQILPVIIHEHEALREAASFGQPIVEYAPDSAARGDFEALADWLDDHVPTPHVTIETMPVNMPVMVGPAGAMDAHAMGGPAHAPMQPPMQPTIPNFGVGYNPDAQLPDPAAGTGRAAELARKVRELSMRAVAADAAAMQPAGGFAGEPPPAMMPVHQPPPGDAVTTVPYMRRNIVVDDARESAAQAARPRPGLENIFGARQTSHGVLFVQPGNVGRQIAVAGDFNGWSASATPMRYNEALGVFETVVAMPPGRYQYRLVVDGRWIADPHNSARSQNSFGESNSLVDVMERQVAP